MGGTRPEKNYSYKTYFETRRENQDFGRQNISMSRPPLDSAPFGTNATNRTTSSIESIPVNKKRQTPRHWHDQSNPQHKQRINQSKKEKRMYHRTQSQTYHFQTHHRTNLIRQMIPVTANQTKINAIQRKSVGNTGNRSRQTHRRAILIRPATVTTDASDVKRRVTGKRIL